MRFSIFPTLFAGVGLQVRQLRMHRLWVLALLLLVGGETLATTFVVNDTADAEDASPADGICATAGGTCTLRAAVQQANASAGADTVRLPSGTYLLTIPGAGEDLAVTGDLDVTENLTINGTGTATTIVDANELDRGFDVHSSVAFSASGLMISNGRVTDRGAGIRTVDFSSLTLNRVTINDSDAGGGRGGAIAATSGSVSLTSVTLSGNSARDGGGIYTRNGSVSLTDVTIASNSVIGKGAGIRAGSAVFTVTNTIVANNTGDEDCERSIGPGTANLDSDGSCGFATTADPLLGPLADNGGSSFTHAADPVSPALETGAGCQATDQRGVTRPVDGDDDTVALCDIGAFELDGIQIGGTIVEDVNGDADLTDGVPLSGVAVSIYNDDGNGVPDAGDGLVGSTTTNASGGYIFSVSGTNAYWVVVDSKTVGPSAGLNSPPFAATHAWAEQTAGPGGGLCDIGDGSSGTLASPGPCYGGRRGPLSDDVTSLATAEHIARIPIGSPPTTSVSFAFSFNVIVNISAAAQNTANVRSAQGSLDQALANANAILGGNALRFVPTLAPNDGSGRWWRIDFSASIVALESIFDLGTVLDGSAYCAWNDGTQSCAATTTVRETNSVAIGANQAVGLGGTFTTPALHPELEIVDEGLRVSQAQLPLVPHDLEIRNLSIWGDRDPVNVANGAARLTGVVIERNVLGSPPGAFSQPATLPPYGVRIEAATGPEIRDNLIGFVQRAAVHLTTTTDGSVVLRNEIRRSGLAFNTWDGVLIWGAPSTVEGNLIVDHEAFGLDTISSGGGHTIRENTFTGNGAAGVQTAGMRLNGTGNTLTGNAIENNAGAGILVVSSGATVQNRISQNRFGGNGGVAIDLVSAGGNDSTGDGVTLNDGTQLGSGAAGNTCGTVAGSGNLGLDFPVIDAVSLAGDVTGRACPGATVEVYRATAGAGDTAGGVDHGEGVAYLGSAVAAGGNFLLNVGPLTSQDELTAIAIIPDGNTSEFSVNASAPPLSLVKRALQMDGTPIPNGSALPRGMAVRFLLYVQNTGGITTDIRIQDALDPLFGYVPGSIQVDNSYSCATTPCDAADEALIFSAVDGATTDCHGSGSACSDGNGDDVVRYDAAAAPNPEVSVGGAGNLQLDIAGGKVWAVLLTVRIQ